MSVLGRKTVVLCGDVRRKAAGKVLPVEQLSRDMQEGDMGRKSKRVRAAMHARKSAIPVLAASGG